MYEKRGKSRLATIEDCMDASDLRAKLRISKKD